MLPGCQYAQIHNWNLGKLYRRIALQTMHISYHIHRAFLLIWTIDKNAESAFSGRQSDSDFSGRFPGYKNIEAALHNVIKLRSYVILSLR